MDHVRTILKWQWITPPTTIIGLYVRLMHSRQERWRVIHTFLNEGAHHFTEAESLRFLKMCYTDPVAIAHGVLERIHDHTKRQYLLNIAYSTRHLLLAHAILKKYPTLIQNIFYISHIRPSYNYYRIIRYLYHVTRDSPSVNLTDSDRWNALIKFAMGATDIRSTKFVIRSYRKTHPTMQTNYEIIMHIYRANSAGQRGDDARRTILYNTLTSGNIRMIRFLDKIGFRLYATINDYYAGNQTPMCFAIYSGNLRLVKHLMHHGADPVHSDAADPIYYLREACSTWMAAQSHDQYIPILEYLLKKSHTSLDTIIPLNESLDTTTDIGIHLLYAVCKNGNLDTIKYLLSKGVDIQQANHQKLVHNALGNGCTELFKFVFNRVIMYNTIDITRLACKMMYEFFTEEYCWRDAYPNNILFYERAMQIIKDNIRHVCTYCSTHQMYISVKSFIETYGQNKNGFHKNIRNSRDSSLAFFIDQYLMIIGSDDKNHARYLSILIRKT